MSDPVSHVRIDDSLAESGIRSAVIDIPGQAPRKLEFESYDGRLAPEAGAEPFLLGSLLLLMSSGYDVHVHGSVTARGLRNIEELQHIWARWKPESYSRIAITADSIHPGYPKDGPAIAAFSGGVDACYTMQQHMRPSYGAGQIKMALFVHGFDIPEEQTTTFQTARARGEQILAGTGIPTAGIRTNFRSLGQEWVDSHGLAIASCLTLFQPEFSVAFIGSSDAYDAFFKAGALPWGSTPMTDHLYSTGLMDIRHDGAGASRTEKIKLLRRWPEAELHLRFCWQGSQLDRNCGKCEKCIRTYLSFLATGGGVPPCFESIPSRSDIRWVKVHTHTMLIEFEEVAEYAANHSQSGPWLDDLRFAIRQNRAYIALKSVPGLKPLVQRFKNIV